MKTTITIRDAYHKELRKMAIDQSITLNDLIERAIEQVFFANQTNNTPSHNAFQSLQGILKDLPPLDNAGIKELKNIWNYTGPK